MVPIYFLNFNNVTILYKNILLIIKSQMFNFASG